MTFDYATLRDSVVEPQIANFGKDATLTQPGTPTGDEWNPTPGTPVTYPVKVLEVDFTSEDRANTLVQNATAKFMLSTAGDPSPDRQGTLTVGSTVYQVIKLKPKSPGATTMFWYAYCGK